MKQNLIAKASTTIGASPEEVWDALVDPVAIKAYMFGATTTSDWRKGSAITWKGVWKGKAYADKGVVLEATAPRVLQYSHFSPLSGKPDAPENYHIVTIALTPAAGATHVSLTQDNNVTDEEREDSAQNWKAMLVGLKKYVEQDVSSSVMPGAAHRE